MPTVHASELASAEVELDADVDSLDVAWLEPDAPLEPPLLEAETDPVAEPLWEPALVTEPLPMDPPLETESGPLSDEFELQARAMRGRLAATAIRTRTRRAGCFILTLLENL